MSEYEEGRAFYVRQELKEASYHLKLALDNVPKEEAPPKDKPNPKVQKLALMEDLIWKKNHLNDESFKKVCDFAKVNMGYHFKEHGKVKEFIYQNRQSLSEPKLDVLLSILEGRA
jgi:hypothetical protein